VTVAGLSAVTVTVTQSAAAPTLIVAPPNRDVTYNAGITDFSVSSNTDWSVVSDQTWCTVNPSGNGNGTINANYAENVLVTPRIAHITVNVAGLTPVNVTVTQDGVVGTNDFTENDITVIPNPSNGQFRLRADKLSGKTLVINIYDNTGRFILSNSCKGEKSYRFDLSTKSKGEYIMRISAEGQVFSKKVIIQ
jgi:hypothetical protein